VDKFDREHMVLVELINEMFVLVRDKGSLATLSDAVAKLIDYTKVHFTDEEEAMEKVNCPFLEEHKEIHANLLEQVLEFQERMEHEGEELRTDLYRFLRDWLVNHILEEDMKYSAYLKDEQESAAAVTN
jgi:hemerythrin-like metal-binding protein